MTGWLGAFAERLLRSMRTLDRWLDAPQAWWLEHRAAREKAELAADPIVAETHRQLLAEWADRTFPRRRAGIENPDRRPAAQHQRVHASHRLPWSAPQPRHPGRSDPLEDQ